MESLPAQNLRSTLLRPNAFGSCNPDAITCDDAQILQIKPLANDWFQGVCTLSSSLRKMSPAFYDSKQKRWTAHFHLTGSPEERRRARDLIKTEVVGFLKSCDADPHFEDAGNFPTLYFLTPPLNINFLNFQRCSETYGALIESNRAR